MNAGLPWKHVLRLTPDEFLALPEYSRSLPTGTTIGKRWRRHEPTRIWVGEYFDVGLEDQVGIRWYRPVIRVPAIIERPRPWWLFARCDHLVELQLSEGLEQAGEAA